MQRFRAVVQCRDRLVRELLAEWLEQRARVAVVALVGSGGELAAAAFAHGAQLLILEADAVAWDPAELVRQLAGAAWPDGGRPCTIGIHRALPAAALRRLRAAGFDRLVDYCGGVASLCAAVTALSADLAAVAAARLAGRAGGVGAPRGAGRLTTRELAVLQLLYLGGRSREIAAALDVTAGTVESHKRRIFAKLEVHSWIQAIVRADDLGLIRGARPEAAARPQAAAAPVLTPREHEVLALLGAGYTVKQAAHRLGIAEKTVESVQRHLFGKLGVHDRIGALAAVYGRASPRADQDP